MFSMYSSSYEGKAGAHILTCEVCLSVWSVCECVSPFIFNRSHRSVDTGLQLWDLPTFLLPVCGARAFLILCLPQNVYMHLLPPSLSLSLESDDICGCLPLIIVIQWNGEIAAGMKRGGGGERYVSVRKTSEPECLHMHSVFKSEDDCWGSVGKRIVGAKIPESESLKDSHVVSLCQSQNMQSLKFKCVFKIHLHL